MREAPYSIPKEPGRWRALGLALAVHLALLLFFWIGIDWQNETPVAVEAELWSPTTREAAPAQPQPEPTPEPKPEPKPEPVVKPQPKTEPEQPVAKNPDIALEKEKKRKELEKQKQLQAEKEKQQKLKQQAEQEKRDKEEKEKQKKLAEQKAEQQKKDKEKAEQQKKQDAIAKKIREEEMRRLTGAVGSGGAGQAAQSQGNNRGDASYGQKVAAKIRSNTIFNVPDSLGGNPAVEYDVELLPDGSVRSLRLNKSSGLPGFDEAVKRAIQASQPFPPDKTGRVPSGFTVVHKPKDQ